MITFLMLQLQEWRNWYLFAHNDWMYNKSMHNKSAFHFKQNLTVFVLTMKLKYMNSVKYALIQLLIRVLFVMRL